MGKILDALMAMGCLALISALWLTALGLFVTVLMQTQYAFAPLAMPAWRNLYIGFLQGGTLPLGFILITLAASLLAVAGEVAILWRLPRIVAAMPMPSLPHVTLPRLRFPNRPPRAAQQQTKPRTEPALNPAPAPSPPASAEPPAPTSLSADPAILARILALFDVWNEPPPAWMAEALRDEVVLLSPDAWPTLESLGSQGLDLLMTLQEHNMLPESPAALRAIGEVETLLRAGIADTIVRPETASPAPVLTLAASWLCEALENFLAGQADPSPPTGQLPMAQAMLERAMRGMTETDWASLDQFPEKASRIRILTDRLREDLRRPAHPTEAIIALLKQFGFVIEAGASALDPAPLLAQRDDLMLLVQSLDLKGGAWRLPEGLLGPWTSGQTPRGFSPGRQLWQHIARRRLRQADPRPLAGLLILHGGQIEQEALLAGIVAADRHRSPIGLAWLSGDAGALPSLQQELSDLSHRCVAEQRAQRSADHSASP